MNAHTFLDIMFGKSEFFLCSSYVFCKTDTLFDSPAAIQIHICSLSMCFVLQEASMLMHLK